MNQSLHLTKDRFAWIILSYVILSKLKVNNRTCLHVWHTNLPQYLSDKIEHVQKRAFRIIHPGRRYDDALSIAQCPRLTDRRQILCCKTFKKIQEPSSQLHYLLPSSREDMHGRFLRNNLDYTVPRCRTDRYKEFYSSYVYSKTII